MDWRNETRTCHCGKRFQPKREAQRHCDPLCRDKAAKRRTRSMDKSGDKKPDLSVVPRSMDTPVTRQSEASEMDSWPICSVCGLWQLMPRLGQPRHMFCVAVRKAARRDKDAIAFMESRKPSLPEGLERRPDVAAVRLTLGGTDAGPNQLREGVGSAYNDCLASPVPHSEAA